MSARARELQLQAVLSALVARRGYDLQKREQAQADLERALRELPADARRELLVAFADISTLLADHQAGAR